MNFEAVMKLTSGKGKIRYVEQNLKSQEIDQDMTESEDLNDDEWKQEYELIYLSYMLEN